MHFPEGHRADVKTILEIGGEDFNLLMGMEECGELIQALSKFQRAKAGTCNLTEEEAREWAAEEVADVINMCYYLALIVGEDRVDRWLAYKKKRTLRRFGLLEADDDEENRDSGGVPG